VSRGFGASRHFSSNTTDRLNSEDLYSVLRANLIERVSDKESLIRSHAVVALSKLAGSEDPSEVEQDEQTILEVLLDALRSDPAAYVHPLVSWSLPTTYLHAYNSEVRRAALLHIPLSQTTAPDILSRTRDTDPLTRKLVYVSVLQKKLSHPRQLTIAQREQVVTDGLGDREPGVRVAAGKTVAAWFDIVFADEKDKQDGKLWVGDDGGVMRAFIDFLHVFDVVGPGEAVAADALLSIFVTRPGLLDVFIFSGAPDTLFPSLDADFTVDDYWRELTPESALLARVFVEHCLSAHNDALLESASLPVVTAFAFHVQEAYNSLLGVMQNEELLGDGDDDDNEQLDDDIAKAEVILAELLRIAVNLDYSDEIGRRKVFAVVSKFVTVLSYTHMFLILDVCLSQRICWHMKDLLSV
jgi:condensin complex subunit 3